MLIDQFDELIEDRPFRPFRILTADGRSLLVKSPEFAWHPPASRMVYIASGRGDERVHHIDLQQVTQFVVEPSNGNGRRKRK